MDISQITDQLFVGRQPRTKEDYAHAHRLGIRFIINATWLHRPVPDPLRPAIETLWIRLHDFLLLPIPLRALARGVKETLPRLARNERVLIHCRRGCHRSVAVASAVLIAQGMTAKTAMRLIKEKRPKANPYALQIQWRIKKFEKFWRAEHNA